MMRLSFGVAFLVAVGGCVLPPLDGALVRCEADADCPTPQVCVVGVEGDRLCRAPGDPCVAVVDGVSRQQPDGTACAGGICVENACVAPRCGDGVTTAPEACDDGAANSDSAANACRSDCQPAACGDGVLDDGETCDDGAANSDADADACRTTCEPAACGDGVIDATEACDDGAANSDVRANACRTTCVRAGCGDGVRDLDEGCDEGELNSDVVPGACRTGCERAGCGDGVIDEDETCDNGVANSDSAADACRTSCAAAACGDGVIDAGEGCDDGDNNSDIRPDACRTTCVPARCGDNIRDSDEACDEGDGNNDDTADRCRTDCRRARCGDGTPDTGEDCDDGNVVSGDGCRADCGKVESCGDGLPDAGEACDDGNDNPRDGCDETCRRTRWNIEVVTRGRTLGPELELTGPLGVAVDATGAIYIADTGGNRVLRQDNNGTSVFAGTGAAGFSGDNGPAIAAELRGPTDVVVAANGDVYIADRRNDRVRRVTTDGDIDTVVGGGSPTNGDGDGQNGKGVRLRRPRGLTIFNGNRLLIAEEEGGRIRQSALNGSSVSTVVGGGIDVLLEDGPALFTGRLSAPVDVAAVSATDFVIAEAGRSLVRRVTIGALPATGSIVTIAGGGDTAPPASNPVDATSVTLSDLTGIAVSGTDVFVSDAGFRRVFLVDIATTPTLRPLVGSGRAGSLTDGPAVLELDLGRPAGLAIDRGILYFADEAHHAVRKATTNPVGLVTVVGTGEPGVDTEGALATTVGLVEPVAVAPVGAGDLYIADRGARRVYRRSAAGHLRTVAGTGDNGDPTVGGQAVTEPITPSSIVARANGALIVSTVGAKKAAVYEVDVAGEVSELLRLTGDGAANVDGLLNGMPLAIDALGRVIVAGTGFIAVEGDFPDSPITGFTVFAIDPNDVPTAVTSLSATSALMAVSTGLQRVTFDFSTATATITKLGAVKLDGVRGLLGLSGGRALLSSSSGLAEVGADGSVTIVMPRADGPAGDGAVISDSFVESPAGLTRDVDGRVIVADAGTGLIRRVDLLGIEPVETIAGDLHPPGPGPLPQAALYGPRTLVTLEDGSLLVHGDNGRMLQVVFAGVPRVDVVYGHPFAVQKQSNLARFARTLADSATIVADPSLPELKVFDRGVRSSLDVASSPASWLVVNDVVGGPGGFTAGIVAEGKVLVSSRELDCVAVHPLTSPVETFFGVCGVEGPFDGLLRDPGGLAVSPGGAIYLADTGNNRVLRRDPVDDTVSVVIGDGSPSSAGQGAPAREFPLQAPAHVAVDSFGNLFISSTTTVRMVANVDGDADADGDDTVITIFGAGSRSSFPENESRCLAGLALDEDRNRVYVADRCSSFLVGLTSAPVP